MRVGSGAHVINLSLPLAVEADGGLFQRFLSTTSCRSLKSGKKEHPKNKIKKKTKGFTKNISRWQYIVPQITQEEIQR